MYKSVFRANLDFKELYVFEIVCSILSFSMSIEYRNYMRYSKKISLNVAKFHQIDSKIADRLMRSSMRFIFKSFVAQAKFNRCNRYHLVCMLFLPKIYVYISVFFLSTSFRNPCVKLSVLVKGECKNMTVCDDRMRNTLFQICQSLMWHCMWHCNTIVTRN